MVRVGYEVMLPHQVYVINHGMLCTVRVSGRPEAVLDAMEQIERAEVFYLQVR